ncbi:MAG: methyltransferase domain-containing protein [candidate division Zixibacteria bacterium]|nr:methyltransferase domain-containing protein [candidate division Zixibacteria bacterium]
MKPVKLTIEEMYAGSHKSYEAFLDILDQSLNPRSPDTLYDKFNDLDPTSDSIVLDTGCRHAVQACELHRRFGCRVEGIDFVESNIREAQQNIKDKELTHAIEVIQGDIHDMPYPESRFDFIWCRDVLGHMQDLQQAFKSCARVLKANGKMLIFEVFATDLLTEEEAKHLWTPAATMPENMSREFFERAFTEAGFSIIEADVFSSEWREYGEETESKITSKQLLRIARLRRNRERYIAEFGEKDYACELANCHYGVYQMLGKLSPVVYSLVNSGYQQ